MKKDKFVFTTCVNVSTKVVTLMSKCLAVVVFILAIAVSTFVIVEKFGIFNILNKWHLIIIPSATLGILTLLFIWLNREVWENVTSNSMFIHLFAYACILSIFTSVYDVECLNLVVYLGLFLSPLFMMYVIKKYKPTPLLKSFMYAIHGGFGAYVLVVLLNYALGYAGLEFPIIEASWKMGNIYSMSTLIPPEMIASVVGAEMLPIIFILAAFAEETMFRLPIVVFRNFNIYLIGFLVSFTFSYLHILTRIDLPPEVLLQVITSIAVANAIFVAIFTRTLRVEASAISHLIYNILIIENVPLLPCIILLIVGGVGVIVVTLVKRGKFETFKPITT